MGIPDPTLENYLIGTARRRAAELLSLFAAERLANDETDVMSARVGVVFDDYCAGLLDGIRSAMLPVDAAEARWVRERYVPLMVEFATALRDSIADSRARHAAAQLIQCKVLEQERQLRLVLESSMTSVPTTELASPEK